MNEWHLTLPLSEEDIARLCVGDKVFLSGEVLTARDAAHKRLTEALAQGLPLPVPLDHAAVYYVGPSPARPGRCIGSAGPTTSTRMDPYTPALLDQGLKVMIGKGRRGADVLASIAAHRAVYLAAVGGCGALLSRCVTASEPICYEDLGTEAIRRLTVEELPCIVAADCRGKSIYPSAL